jgi:hypothetical protein
MMTDLTVRQILDAFERGLEETRRKIERGKMRQDGCLDWRGTAEIGEEVAFKDTRWVTSDMTTRQILDAMTRALDTVARRFAERKADNNMSGHPPHQPIE